jgi:hypothetical protein
VDRTVERVIRRISDGGERSVAEPYQYFYGVARAVRAKRPGTRRSGPVAAEVPPPIQRAGRGAAAPADNPSCSPTPERRAPALARRSTSSCRRIAICSSTITAADRDVA